MKKRIPSILLAVVMAITLVPTMAITAFAASINDSAVFLKQQSSDTCTLCSATMMLRRRAIIDGNSNWSAITESAVKSVAWCSDGLYNNFTYSGMQVKYKKFSSTTADGKASEIQSTLSVHPEGIAMYQCGASNIWHAILITDYNTSSGVYCCADPSSAAASGRIQLSQSTLASRNGTTNQLTIIGKCEGYWYISNKSGGGSGIISDSATIEPIGALDVVTGGNGTIYIRGWTFDYDEPTTSLTLHVYSGTTYIGCAVANTERSDVPANPFYAANFPGIGNYHGFDATLETTLSGEQTIDVYAINVGGGNINKLIGSGTVTITNDFPCFSNVKISNVDSSGFDISCDVSLRNGVKFVAFPTWTAVNGQDDIDLNWRANCRGTINGKSVTYHVDTKDHNGENGLYYTHIYAYDKDGNSEVCSLVIYVGNNGDYGLTPVAEKEYNGHTYLIFNAAYPSGNRYTWYSASTFCQSIGGHLVSITSQEENDVVAKMVNDFGENCFIGANDIASEGSFAWENGEQFEYTNWYNGEPNNATETGEDCSIMYAATGTWNDECLTKSWAFVCEIDSQKCDYSYKTVVTAPTCTTRGYTTHTCACGDSYVDSYVNALGHNYVDGICTHCKAKDPNYVISNPFTDVSESAAYYDAVMWGNSKGIVSGFTATEFRPNNTCTRAQVVTFLWRSAGSPEPTSTNNPFKDVSAKQANGKDNPFYKAILWGVENGITTGYSDGTFRPNATVTRGQFVTFLWRYEGKPTSSTELNFNDTNTIAKGYRDAVAWGVENGVIAGYGDNTFRPNATCTRWQVVLFMWRDMKDT